MQKRIVFFNSINSVGSWIMWLTISAAVSTIGHSYFYIGWISAIRQISFLVGSFFAGLAGDKFHPLHWHLYNLLFEAFIATFGLLVAVLNPNIFVDHPFTILIWVGLRFLSGGLTFVLGYKVIGLFGNSWGNSAVLHLLATQGSTIVSPLLALSLSTLSADKKWFVLPFAADLVSLIPYLILIFNIRNKQVSQSRDSNESIIKSFGGMVTRLLTPQLRYEFILQVLVLIGLSGFNIYAIGVASSQSLLPAQNMYLLLVFFYGIALWIGGFLSIRIRNQGILILLGAGLLIICKVPLLVKEPTGHIFPYLLYVLSFGILLNSSNKQILNKISPSETGQTRSSMLFYLSCIFALGELLFSKFAGSANSSETLTGNIEYVRSISGLAIAALVLSKGVSGRTAKLCLTFVLFAFSNLARSNDTTYIRPIPYGLQNFSTTVKPSESDIFVITQIFDTLLEVDNSGKIVPSIASAWQMKEKIVNLKIRDDIFFHAKSPLEVSLERFGKNRRITFPPKEDWEIKNPS